MTAARRTGADGRPLPLPRVLTVVTAGRLGIGKSRIRTELRNGRWQHLAPGIYLTRPDEPRRDDWARTGLILAGPGAVVSGWDAARHYRLGPARPPVEHVLVLATRGTHRIVSEARPGPTGGVRIRPSSRPLERDHFRSLGAPDLGIPIAAPARAVADTALDLRPLEPVRAMVTQAVQRELCTPDQLAAELLAGPRNGSAHLRRAVEDVYGGALSIAEAEAADVLRMGPLPRFELNVPIVDGRGRLLYTADALWRDLRAVLEVDSREYHFLEAAWMRTMDRHNALARFGLTVTHYPPHAFRTRPEAVRAEVATWLRARARELGVAYAPVPDQPGGRTFALAPAEPFVVRPLA